MARFTIGALELEEYRESDFAEFVAIVKGRSIVSAADWGEDRFELGLSGNAMVRWFRTPQGMEVNLISTTNPDEIPPVVFSLGEMPQRVPIRIVERKLRGLRTLYAIYFLAQAGRMPELERYTVEHFYGDIERALIGPEEALYVESLSYGSWIIALWAKTKSAYRALSSAAGFILERGREAYLSRLEAEARLAHARARSEEIAAAQAEFNLRKSQLEYLMEVASRAHLPAAQENIKKLMSAAARDVLAGAREE